MKRALENFTESSFIAEGHVVIGGKTIPYTVISEDNVIHGDQGKPVGSLFTYSYFRKDINECRNRPVIFVYNGGPGSSSIWLHLGLFGPYRVKLDDVLSPPVNPPFKIENNPYCPLDVCDIVMIDPVETGFGCLIEQDSAEQFYGYDQDALSICLVIEGWLTKYNRWASPIYLAGESYGTIRSCVLANMLTGGPNTKSGILNGISVAGIIMLGSAVSTGKELFRENVEPSVINLPAVAAVAWYHKREDKPDLETFVEEAYRFSYEQYLQALFLGDALPSEQCVKVAGSLSYYTGVDQAYFLEHGLRLTINDFSVLLLKNKGLQVGLYDGRYVLKNTFDIGTPDPVADDPAMGQYTLSFIGAMNSIVKKELGITFDRPYKAINFNVNGTWKFDSERTPLQYLLAAMRRNKEMRLFFGTGYFDLATTTGAVRYTASHMGLPSERVTVKEYPSGHMPYLGEDSVQNLARDLKAFITNKQ